MLTLSATLAKGFKVENALPAGYVKDGTADYTSYAQAASNDNGFLIFPSFPILINDTSD